MTIPITDEDIAEAIADIGGINNLTPQNVRERRDALPQRFIWAHAQTIAEKRVVDQLWRESAASAAALFDGNTQLEAKLRVAMEALDRIAAKCSGAGPKEYHEENQWIARQALNQIKGTDHD